MKIIKQKFMSVSTKRFLISHFFLLVFIAVTSLSKASIFSGIYPVGNSAPLYTKISQIADSLNNATITGDVIFELQTDYDGTAGEVLPIIFRQFNISGGSWTVTIRPAAGATARVTSGDPGSLLPLIQLNGINNLILDGRAGGIGNSEWMIRNTRSAATIGPVFTFINDATFNTLNYLSIEGQNPATGLVLFSTSTGTLGNSNNSVTNNSIHDRTDVAGFPGIGIYSVGTNTARNKNNSINNNNLYNWINSGISITAIGNGEGWQITANNFYNTQATNTTGQTSIQFSAGASSFSNTISSNYIGGQMQGAAGGKWINSGALAFNGITINVGATASTLISGNFIQNISLTNISTSSFNGISCVAGSVVITGNTIGSAITLSSINTSGSSTITGINAISAGNTTIQNNTIGNIISSGVSTGSQVRGIVSAGTGVSAVTGNTILNISSACSSTSNTSAAIAGIYINSGAAGQLYSFNTISGLRATNTTVNTNVIGITISSTGNGSLLSNKIFDLSNATSGTLAGLTGIYLASGNWELINNMISVSNTFTNDISVKGIWDNAASSTTNFYYNSIFISGSGNITNKTYAILRSGNSTVSIKNNFLFNNRTGVSNYALGNTSTTPSTGWVANASNNNFFVTDTVSSVNDWAGVTQTFNNWKSISQSDVYSFYETTIAIPSTVFVNPSFGNLKIDSVFAAGASNLESRGLVISGVTADFEGDLRPGPAGSINGGSTLPDIGADEFDGVPFTNDIGVTALMTPSVFSCPGSSELIQFSISNFGLPINLATNNIILNSSVAGPNPITFSPVVLNSGTLASGSSINVIASASYNMSATGTYTFYANSSLTGDTYSNNDSLPPVAITLTQIVALPTTLNFSGYSGTNLTSAFPDWTEAAGSIPTGATSLWTSQLNMGVSGNTSARINLYSTGKNEWIVGPKFNATTTTKLRFSAAVTAKNSITASATMGSDDHVQVMVSTDCGQTWFPVFAMNSSSNLPFQLRSHVVPLDMYAGQRILVAFFASDGSVDNVEDYDFHLDDITISNTINGYDLGVTALLSPVTTGCYSTNDSITVALKNFGPETINFSTTNATVTATITGPLNQTFSKIINTGSLSPWSDTTINITSVLNLSTPGTYVINAFSAITPDYDSTNNAMTPVLRTNAIPMNLPDFIDFTGFTGANLVTAFPNWTEAAGATPTGTTSTWQSQTGLNTSGNITARINLYTTTKNEWLISKKFSPSSSAKLKFFAAVTNYSSVTVGDLMGSDDAVSVMVSTNCGISWVPVFTLNINNNLTTTLQAFSVNLNSYAGTDIMLAFRATDGPIDDTPDYDFHLDEIEIRDYFPIDVGAKKLISPVANGCSGTNETLTIGVKNYGTDTLNFILNPLTINVNITGASTQSFNTVISSGTLLPDSIFSAIVTTAANFSAAGTHVINSTATISGDGSNGNNSFANPISYITTTISNFPYTEGFETTVPGWSIQQISGTGLWSYLNASGTNPTLSPFSGSKMAYFNSNANGFFNAVSRLSTNCFDFTNLNSPKLEFYMSQDKAYQYNKDSLFVVVSTDGGASWSLPVFSLSRYNASYTTPGWKKNEVCLDQYAGMSGIKIGFVAKSAFGSNIFIDAVKISETSQPVAGFISSSANLLCGGMNTILNLYSYSGSVQWQQSLDNISFTNISGANFDTLTSVALWDTTFFRVITSFNNVCVATASSTSIEVDVLPAPRINLGTDSIICANSYVLNAGVQDPGTTFQWNDGSTNQLLTTTNSGQYYVTGTSGFFCQTTDTINITLKTPVIVNAGTDQIICEGNSATLSATGGSSYLWSTGASSPTIIVSPSVSTLYTVIASGVNGCFATDTVHVNVSSLSFANLGPDTTQCGSAITINAGSSSNTYLWNTGAITPSITITNSGSYFVEATNPAGCSSSDTINITINPVVSINLGPDVTQCGGSVFLNAGNPGSTYIWNTGASSQTITTNLSGTYYVSATNVSGCTSADTLLVNINPLPVVNLGPDVFACNPDVTLSTGSNGNYTWNTGASTPTLLVSNSGTYSVAVNLNGCILTDTINVTLSNPPIVNLGTDTTSCSASVLLNAGNSGSTYLWNTGTTGQTAMAYTSGNYSVLVTAAGGCSQSDTIKVTIHPSVAANAGADLAVCSGSAVQLSASGGITYLWNGSISGQNITITPTSNVSYTVSVTDVNGCMGTDQVNVAVTNGPFAAFNFFANAGTVTTTNTSTNTSAYVWDFGDGSALDIATAPTHTYLTSGTYTILLTAVNGCGTDTTSQILTLTIGLEEIEFANAIIIYPVPTSGMLTVYLQRSFDKNVFIKIISVEGKLVDEKTIEKLTTDKVTFDLTNLTPGLYFVQMTNDKTVITKKIILQK
ncbi:MAG: hypothetical protein A3F72_16550 [Bacteroidetes bacterium RIFCSPLOWO2_12_FULL_35_15]|nr:MAG: hypothetical protein A3F72_16550 [Bacteroidetes bacterium RIFCSPLOWO2_12_FULL_35_15]